MTVPVRRILSRIAVLTAALILWHLSQRWIGARGVPAQGLGDAVHGWLAPLNAALALHPQWTNALLIVSSLGIDVVALTLLLRGVLGPCVRPLAGVLILFGLRQLAQAATALPAPPGMLWRDPGFPSLFVTYSVGNDFFFSGHTALAVFGALEIGRRAGFPGRVGLALFALGEALVVLALRAHYTLDVISGAAMAAVVWLSLNQAEAR